MFMFPAAGTSGEPKGDQGIDLLSNCGGGYETVEKYLVAYKKWVVR